jgi:hypothetical protein
MSVVKLGMYREQECTVKDLLHLVAVCVPNFGIYQTGASLSKNDPFHSTRLLSGGDYILS